MRVVTNKYQLAWNSLRIDIQSRIREIDNAENVGWIDEYLEVERDTLEGLLQTMESEEREIKEKSE